VFTHVAHCFYISFDALQYGCVCSFGSIKVHINTFLTAYGPRTLPLNISSKDYFDMVNRAHHVVHNICCVLCKIL